MKAIIIFMACLIAAVSVADVFLTTNPKQVITVSDWPNENTFFYDDFEGSPSTWDIGDGSLTTPAGSEGYWSFWDRATAVALGCPNPETLPAHSDGWLVFMEQTNGYGGGQAIRTDLQQGCANGYPGTNDYHFGANYQEIYLGLHIKYEDGYNKTAFSSGCKIPYRVLVTPSGSPNLFIQYAGGSFSTSEVAVLSAAFNGGNWWNSGIGPNDIYTDHDWHWLEVRIKFNSTGAASDGEIQFWIDGVEKNSKTNEKFYTSGTQYFQRIWLEQGNCSDNPWEQIDWKSVWFDNFTISTSYIGPPP